LPEPEEGRRDGSVETNLARKGMFVAGRRARPGGDQLVLRVIASRDRLGEIRRVDEQGPALTEVEFVLSTSICTAWKALGDPYAVTIPITLTMFCRDLGWSDSGRNLQRVARGLSALTQATFAGEVYDATTGELTMVHEFGLVQEWKAGRPNRAGALGEVGFVMVTDWLRRQLAADHQTYYSRELLRELRRPVAKLLLPWIEGERFEERTPQGGRIKRWPITRELFASVGIGDSKPRQARVTLQRAGEEIVERDASGRWVRIAVEQTRARAWQLVAERAA
jgi:hypothetical protein